MANKKVTKKKKRSAVPCNLKATDNIPKGSELNVPAGMFMAFFGDALLEHYSKDISEDDEKE